MQFGGGGGVLAVLGGAARVGRTAAMAARAARTVARVMRLAATVRGLAYVARGAAKLSKVGKLGKMAGSAFRFGTRMGKIVSTPFRSGFAKIGAVAKTNTGKGLRYTLTGVADISQIGFTTYEVATLIKAAKKAKAAREGEVDGGGGGGGGGGQERVRKEGETDWFYVDSKTGERVWLQSAEEAKKVHDAGVHQVFSHVDSEEVVEEGEEGEGGELSPEVEAVLNSLAAEAVNEAEERRVRRSAETDDDDDGEEMEQQVVLAWHYQNDEGETVWLLTYEEALRAHQEGREVSALHIADIPLPRQFDEADEDNDEEVREEMELFDEESKTYTVTEGQPLQLIEQYYNTPGRDTMQSLAFFVGADYVERYVDNVMEPHEAERWGRLYPNWRRELRWRPSWDDRGPEADERLRWYFFHPTPKNLWKVVSELGLNYVLETARWRASHPRQAAYSRAIWQTTEKMLEDRVEGERLLQKHLDNPDEVSMDEAVTQLGTEFVDDWLERILGKSREERHDMMIQILASVAETVAPAIPVSSAYRLSQILKKKEEEEEDLDRVEVLGEDALRMWGRGDWWQ